MVSWERFGPWVQTMQILSILIGVSFSIFKCFPGLCMCLLDPSLLKYLSIRVSRFWHFTHLMDHFFNNCIQRNLEFLCRKPFLMYLCQVVSEKTGYACILPIKLTQEIRRRLVLEIQSSVFSSDTWLCGRWSLPLLNEFPFCGFRFLSGLSNTSRQSGYGTWNTNVFVTSTICNLILESLPEGQKGKMNKIQTLDRKRKPK